MLECSLCGRHWKGRESGKTSTQSAGGLDAGGSCAHFDFLPFHGLHFDFPRFLQPATQASLSDPSCSLSPGLLLCSWTSAFLSLSS